MKFTLITLGSIAGIVTVLGWWLAHDDDEQARHDAWKIDHDRRAWSQGEDGQPWNWREFKHRDIS